jgi:hypothetical protein
MEYFSFIFVLFEVTVTKWFKVHTIVLCFHVTSLTPFFLLPPFNYFPSTKKFPAVLQ